MTGLVWVMRDVRVCSDRLVTQVSDGYRKKRYVNIYIYDDAKNDVSCETQTL